MKKYQFIALLVALLVHVNTVAADEFIVQSVGISGSLCVGANCTAAQDFGFDTIRISSDSPQIFLDDTSNSASFPQNDWLFGIADDLSPGTGTATAHFFIKDATSDAKVLELTPSGDVALGAGSAVVEGAVSMGADGSERRVAFVADPVDDTDAVNLRTAQAIVNTTTVTQAANTLDTQITLLNARLDDLSNRLDALTVAD